MKQNLKITTLPLILILLISSCSMGGRRAAPNPVEIITEPIQIEIYHPPLPKSIQLERPDWFVVSEKNIDEFLARLSKIQADNQLRFQQLEEGKIIDNTQENQQLSSVSEQKEKKILPGSSEPQDLGSISYKDSETNLENQITQSVESTGTVVTETYQAEEKILPEAPADKQYEFATSLLKVGDYNTAERAFREFVNTNPEHQLAGSAQYWYAETFRIRQLYTDAASAYLEGYQKYPKSEKAPINLLKLGVSLVQMGEKDQGCLMIVGVKKQYPNATQSVLQKAIYEEKKFECKKENS